MNGDRFDEREIDVIDTPGVIDTSIVQRMSGIRGWLTHYKEDQAKILTEVAKIFTMAPDGLDAITLVVKYGCRFTPEDAQALQLLQSFLGDEAETHMILILSHADDAKRKAIKNKVSLDEWVKRWIGTLPPWVQNFIERIGENNVVLFDNTLDKEEQPDAYKKQLSEFVQVRCDFLLFTLKHCMKLHEWFFLVSCEFFTHDQ